jgi:toxin ParE1/3/4
MSSAKPALVWSTDAEADLFEIWNYLSRESSHAIADTRLRLIDECANRLRDWPYLSRTRDELLPGMRSVVVESHLIFFQVSATTVDIVRVVHGNRDIDAIFRPHT